MSGKITHPGKVPAGHMVGSDHARHHWYVWALPALAREKHYCMLRSGGRGTMRQPLFPAVCGDQGAPSRRLLKGAETWSAEQEGWGGVLISQQTGGVGF